MIDIHSHILPGIDDGAEYIEESIEICETALSEGIETIIATPHYISREGEIEKTKLLSYVFMLNQELKNENINVTILPGMEIYINPELSQLYSQDKIITLNLKNYMLMELPLYNRLPVYLDDAIFNLQIKGIKPVIAHPERCKAVMDNPNIVYRLINNKCFIQVNSGSIVGLYGRDAQKTANLLLQHNMVHFVASDCHSLKGRKSLLKEAYDMVAKKFSIGYADDLFINNQQKIINGESIITEEPLVIKRKKFWIV